MEDEAVIGRLYKALLVADGEKQALLRLFADLKAGRVALDRVQIDPDGGLRIRGDQPAPVELHAVEDADEA